MMDTFKFEKVKEKKNDAIHGISEEKINKQQADDEKKKAEAGKIKAETFDITSNTWLKISLAVFIAFLMIGILLFQSYVVHQYISYVLSQQKEVPTSVIVAVLASGSSVATLMGFILKGLFGSKL